jgi:hypothetical protein
MSVSTFGCAKPLQEAWQTHTSAAVRLPLLATPTPRPAHPAHIIVCDHRAAGRDQCHKT